MAKNEGFKGSCQVKKIKKSEKNLEVGGWVGQAPTRIFLCCFLYIFKKNWMGGGCCLANSNFLQIFGFFFNLKRHLGQGNNYEVIKLTIH